jgi:putative membrane protein
VSEPADRPEGFEPESGEPDYRFSLANERTFLAWVRTSLALFAGGVGVIGVANHFSTSPGRAAIGCGLLLLGALSAGTAYRRWQASEAAIRAGRPLPPTRMLLVVGAGMSVVALLGLALAIAGIA